MNETAVHTMHWDNIPSTILQKQKEVFDQLQINLTQENANKKSHGLWMNEVIDRSSSEQIIIFCDIDAFPLHRKAYEHAVACAARDAIFGLAQFSNHKPGTALYAGPMFMAFKKSVWARLGRPALNSSSTYDAAEVLSEQARQAGVELVLSKPSSCLIPKWALANEGVFGIGTFYGDCDFFHLFESRKPAYEQIFSAVAADVTGNRPLRFNRYLEIVAALHAADLADGAPPRRAGFWKRLFS